MEDALFDELQESVREGSAILRGEGQASRAFVVEVHDEAQEAPPTPNRQFWPPTTPPASSNQFKWTRRVLILLACLALSILAAIVTSQFVSSAYDAGYFVRWHRLPDPPAAATGLSLNETGDAFVLVARLASGDYVSLPFHLAAWSPSGPPPPDSALPCTPSLAALAWTTNPPDGLTTCIQHMSRGADCHIQRVYALDGDGRVWQWSNAACAMSTLGVAMITFVASALVYLFLSLGLAVLWSRRRAN